MQSIIRLRMIVLFLGMFGLVSSLVLAAHSFILIAKWNATYEFNQFVRPGDNPFQDIAYRFAFIAISFALYVFSLAIRRAARFKYLVLIPLSYALFQCVLLKSNSNGLPTGPIHSCLVTLTVDNNFYLFYTSLILILHICFLGLTSSKRELLK